ncbi:hypothetical protein [Microseira sp. BLCC-F43]|uniref:hypothetical protein n=1 Tax=Microseira sp. BLCC-F43 TaxID=3153602 RepID=UPI0035B9A0AC
MPLPASIWRQMPLGVFHQLTPHCRRGTAGVSLIASSNMVECRATTGIDLAANGLPGHLRLILRVLW